MFKIETEGLYTQLAKGYILDARDCVLRSAQLAQEHICAAVSIITANNPDFASGLPILRINQDAEKANRPQHHHRQRHGHQFQPVR